jgi:hypothetical protein
VDRKLSFLSQDPDERVVRWGWVLWFAWLAVGGTLLLGDFRGGAPGLGAVLAAPFWGVWALWALYRFARSIVRWMGHSGWHEWSGQYYEFDGRQIRILFDGDEVWFAAADVFEALDTPGPARHAERVRHIVGRDGLRTAPGSDLLSFSEKGLAAWLDRRTDRTASLFARWVETQVMRPYRRRRELEASPDESTTTHEK